MFNFCFEKLMPLNDEERNALAKAVASVLREPGSEAGKLMLDAYYQATAQSEPATRNMMIDFIEMVRINYVCSETHPDED
ncbi:hypothetical protein ACPB3E_10530 [Escherichia coli]